MPYRLLLTLPSSYYNVGLAKARSGELDEAIEQLATTATLNQDDAEAELVLGKLYAQKKNFRMASQHFEKALAIQEKAQYPDDEVEETKGLLAALGHLSTSETGLIGGDVHPQRKRARKGVWLWWGLIFGGIIIALLVGVFTGGFIIFSPGPVSTQLAKIYAVNSGTPTIVSSTPEHTQLPSVNSLMTSTPTEDVTPTASETLSMTPTITKTATVTPTTTKTATMTPTNTMTASMTPTSTITKTPTLAVFMINAIINTNCRLGPDPAHDIIGYLEVGMEVVVVGRLEDGEWWFIQNPSRPSTGCWVWGETTMVEGDPSILPVIPPPPIPIPKK